MIAKEKFADHVAYDIIKANMENPPILDDIPNNENLYLKADVEISNSWGGGMQEWA